MNVTGCTFTDNQAFLETHGFSISDAILTIDSSQISASQTSSTVRSSRRRSLQTYFKDYKPNSFIKGSAVDEASIDAAEVVMIESEYESAAEIAKNQITAGFFYVTNKSTLQLTSTTQSGTYGSVASAIYLNSGSKLIALKSKFTGLPAPDECKFGNSGVIVSELADEVRVEHIEISDSSCSYIYSDRTPVIVTDSKLSGGKKKPYISMIGSSINMEGSTLSDSVVDNVSKGRGFNCLGCTEVTIKNSNFTGLNGYLGGAIYL